ncbi:MAG: transcriptional regulator, LysR family [Firmicutes bacterium]|nr:transcriptional regulator, LysR family [Bacillota bacterium]
MELHQLQYFKAVATLQHMTKAAETLAVSQPALSRSISKLEEELGVPLFQRQGKSILINKYGRSFLRYVERALGEIEAGQQALQDLTHPHKGMVAIAFLQSLGAHMVPDLLGKFRMDYPEINFKLYQTPTLLLQTQLEEGEIDLCLCSPIISSEIISWVPLFSEELFIIVPPKHRLSSKRSIFLREIAKEPLITFKKDYALRVIGDQLFKQTNINPPIMFEGEEIPTVAGLVEANLGVALIPRIPSLDRANIVFLPIAEPQCCREIGIAWIKDRYMPQASKKFRDFVIDFFRKEHTK